MKIESKSKNRIQIESKIAKLLNKATPMAVNFQESRIVGGVGIINMLIRADNVWFDADSTGRVAVAC